MLFHVTSEDDIRVIDEQGARDMEGGSTFASEQELQKLATEWPMKRLVAIWNHLPGVHPVARFTDRKTAIARIWRAIQPQTDADRPSTSDGNERSENVTILIKTLIRMSLLKDDLDYNFVRASMVIIYFFFGYQKWFDYEAKGLVPFFTHGPLIFWMYPVFGMKGATGHPCPRCQHIVRVIEPVPLHISVNLPGNRRDMRGFRHPIESSLSSSSQPSPKHILARAQFARLEC